MSLFSNLSSACVASEPEGSIQLGDDAEHSTGPKRFSVPQLKRTRLCRYYTKTCRNGISCPFAHGGHELEKRPDLSKTSLCKAWLAGTPCKPGCLFAHGRQELRIAENGLGSKGQSRAEVARIYPQSASHQAGRRGTHGLKSELPKKAVVDAFSAEAPSTVQLVWLQTATVKCSTSSLCGSGGAAPCQSMTSLPDFNGYSSDDPPSYNTESYEQPWQWQNQQQELLDRDHVIRTLLTHLSLSMNACRSPIDSQCADMAMLEHLLILAQPTQYED